MTHPKVLSRRLLSVFKDTGKQMKEAQLPLVASSLAYITILSIIPLLAVSFAIFQAFGGLSKVYSTLEPFIISNLAEGSSDEVMDKVKGFIANAHASAVGVGGLIGLIFTSMSMLSNIEQAINRVWAAPISRSIFQRISSYWLFITLGPLALAVAVGAATSKDMPLERILPNGAGLFAISIGILFGIYKWVPHCRVNSSFALISATVTSFLINLAQVGYRLYTAKVVTYSKIYGSLGAIPIFLLWIYIVWIIILTGAALTAALQKRFEVDRQAVAAKQATSDSTPA